MKAKQVVKNIYYFLVAFALTNSALITFLSNVVDGDLPTLLNRVTLYAIVIISIGLIISKKEAIAKVLPAALFLGCLVVFQVIFFDQPEGSSYLNNFVIHGFGGLCVGIALTDYKKLIKFAGALSFLFGLIFIAEPINRSLLKVNEMSTGYSLIPLVIFMLLWFFTSEQKSRYILLLVAFPLGITTFLFTSRGCGLSIVLAVAMFYITKLLLKKQKINKRMLFLSFSLVLLFVLSTVLIGSGFINIDGLNEGSLLYKIFNGTLIDSNGRSEIWDMGFDILREYPWIGVGFGGDHIIAESYFERYSSIHNVLLEVLINFGIPLGLLIICMYFIRFYKGVKNRVDYTAVMLVWAITSSFLLKLVFSSTYLDNMLPVMLVYGICTNLYYSKRNLKLGAWEK